jgi:hypothetical protein
MTAWRKACSLALLVGSTPSCRIKAHSQTRCSYNSAHSHQGSIAALEAACEQPLHRAADRRQPTLQGRAADRAVAIVGPVPEQRASGAAGFNPNALLGRRRRRPTLKKIPLQVSPAPLQSLQRQVYPRSIAMNDAQERFAQ